MTNPDEPKRVPEPKLPRKRRSAVSRVFRSFFVLGLLALLVAGTAAVYAYQAFDFSGPLDANKVVTIERGLGTPEIASLLQEQGVIGDARVFSAMAYLTGARSRLKAGEYEFARGESMRDVMAKIAAGKSIAYKISIPEGWTSEMAVARLMENEVLTGEVSTVPPEGSILPDTYVFKRGMTRQKLLDDMQAAQARLLDEIWASRRPDLGLKDKEELVTLASIVEKETGLADERPLIASVFMNRLNKGMRLQSDPTIIYGIVGGKGKLDRSLTRTDIRTPTPYNTYTIAGLPPGPIANPGRAALQAVANHPNTDYIFFVADGSGGHAFASTLDEHNRNVANWRRMVSASEASAAAEEAEEAAAEAAATGASAAAPEAAPEPQPDPATATTQSLPAITPDPPAPSAESVPLPGATAAEAEPAAPGPAAVPVPEPQPQPPAAQVAAAEPPAPASPEPAETPAEAPAAAAPVPVQKPVQKPAQQVAEADLEPGSIVTVKGRLVAIPVPNPRR
ncbi:MAG: endolytic transglycosylase MltG [Hyphomicrobiales bacterium]